MKTERKVRFACFWAILFLLICAGSQVYANRTNDYKPTQYAVGAVTGYTYDPSEDTWFYQITGFALYDYDRIWKHSAPDNLRFKIETNMGIANFTGDENRFMGGAGVMALYYLESLSFKGFTPYGEAGVGAIYTDYQTDGQGTRLNFNPQVGVGVEFRNGKTPLYFLSIRGHHISNAGLNSDNRGQNSIVIQAGRYF